MSHRKSAAPPRFGKVRAYCALAFLLAVSAGCGGDDAGPAGVTKIVVEPNQTLSTAPHRFDVYRPEDADKAVVFLHGGGGTKELFAYQLGVKRTAGDSDYDAENEQILIDNKAIAVFPQGQAIPSAPAAYTWNNYVMDSGQDDLQFIRDLVAHISTQFGVSRIFVVGHSNGGMMVNRVWCEAPELFEAYIAISGPPSQRFEDTQTPCAPAIAKPFLTIVGARDDVLQNDDWEAQSWTVNPILAASPAFVDPVLIGDRFMFPERVTRRCGGTVQSGDADAVKDGKLATWSFCDGSIELIRVETAGHSVDSLESASGRSLLEFAFDFINAPR